MATTTTPAIHPLLAAVKTAVDKAGVFGGSEIKDQRLVCKAANAAAPAAYRLEADGQTLYVSLVMADRWLSESIETDLVHTGDKLDELLEEELAELDYKGKPLRFEHYRSEDLLFTFRSPLPIAPGDASPEAVRTATTCLLAYEQCFRRLGDMDAGPDEE